MIDFSVDYFSALLVSTLYSDDGTTIDDLESIWRESMVA
jgi:hypothetical protein